MKNLTLSLVIIILLPFISYSQEKPSYKLWYKQPAKVWTEALPIGNGRLGGMVFGNYKHEVIQMNEESVWAGSKINNNNSQSAGRLPEIQKAIFENRFADAKDLATKYMVGTPARVRSYQPLGNWTFNFSWNDKAPEAYKRSLNLNEGVHETTYTIDGNTISKKVFVSASLDAMIVSITAQKPISFSTGIARRLDVDQYADNKESVYFIGQINDKEEPEQGPGGKHMRFCTMLKVISSDGNWKNKITDTSAGIEFQNAQNIVLALTGVTDYDFEKLDLNPSKDILKNASSILNGIKNSNSLLINHIKQHSEMFNRVSITLKGDSMDDIPTDERLKQYKTNVSDLGLPVLFYQYGRYLLMASSRPPARLPANLQGLWNKDYEAPWNSDFHTNINLQMNYWPAYSGNLIETGRVLTNFMDRLRVPASITAKEMYKANGWTLHHLTDPFGRTGVADGVWGVSPMNGPWMALSVYDLYDFTRNKKDLEKLVYPIIKGSVEWVLDFLIDSPEGYLVTNPSHSPENAFSTIVDGKRVVSQLSYASTIDIQIIQDLFSAFEKSALLLKKDDILLSRMRTAREKLPPIRIGKNGTIQEWIEDYDEVEPGHRHMSHLFGLYPGNTIGRNNPELMEAARKTIDRRLSAGGGHTGWSKAWIVNFYARLLDGNKAGKHLHELISKTCLPNLFSTHPPFQIDGNFGGAAGVAEMLLQSHEDELHVLPAIPDSWNTGEFKGLVARGGFVIDVSWKNNKLITLDIISDQAIKIKIRFKEKDRTINLKKGLNKLGSVFNS